MSENKHSGVSPVIGIILMVGISVALVALASTLVFDIGGNVNKSSTGHSVDIKTDQQSDSILATVSRNPDLERTFVRGDGINDEQEIASSKGETGTASISPSSSDGTVEIVGETEDGGEQILDTKQYEGFSGSGSGKSGTGSGKSTGGNSNNVDVTGIVRVNPPIDGATVKAVKSDGTVAATTTTDTSGEYSFGISQQQIAEVVVNVEGADELSNPLYVSKIKPATSGEVNFDFDETSKTTTDADGDGSDESIIFETDSNGNKLIGNAFQLQQMSNDLSASYKIINDIDASVTSSWNGGKGFDPIASGFGSEFTGTLDGQGHTIERLTIDRSEQNVGLFADSNGRIENIGLVNYDITADKKEFVTIDVGTLAGVNSGLINNSFADGSMTVNGIFTVGGLVGKNGIRSGDINNSNTSGTINGDVSGVGGIVGKNDFGGSVNRSNSSVSINTEGDVVGGVVGFNAGGEVNNSFATGDITSTSTSDVIDIGGLIGEATEGAIIENSYATGDVTGDGKNVGGLLGLYNGAGSIDNGYATGDVTSTTGEAAGGLVGDTTDSVDTSGSYWDTEATGQTSSVGDGAVALTTSEMQGTSASTNMGEFDFANNWSTVSGDYPELKFQE